MPCVLHCCTRIFLHQVGPSIHLFMFGIHVVLDKSCRTYWPNFLIWCIFQVASKESDIGCHWPLKQSMLPCRKAASNRATFFSPNSNRF
ncbi:hypothetical protein HNY73_014348 [Argiope bruennichi]|uniref:Uncharacterized protein n=1 Tax=Argiope bruennichi TaxID=94029 RepID=A0A8T0ENP0_ARGBR|nr:hypothetical protein HNY73_014348 [Argiope bruennichi]